MQRKGFIGAAMVGTVLALYSMGCSYFTTDRQVALAKSIDCHNRQMILPALACTAANQKKSDAVEFAKCMGEAQVAADGICGPLIGSDFIAGTASMPSPVASPAVAK